VPKKEIENDKKVSGQRQKERRDFLKKVGSIGAMAAVGASLPLDKALGQGSRDMRPPQGGQATAQIDTKTGAVVLNHVAVRTIAGRLRDRIKRDPTLRRRFYVNPREVLGSVGLNEEAQSEILRVDTDFKMRGSPFVDPSFLSFCFCTDCCCTGCCLTCWSTNKYDLGENVSNPAP
jgi:hypothetical protein